ncbi:MAG: hypothetical protein KGR69_11230, partial [Verrucomicrobia bacterium]|nr:hypothetical protein [Verrucomicrobiota bacterium]
GRIHIVYDQERQNGRILMATIREEDVRAGKLVSKDASMKILVHGAAGGRRGGAEAAPAPKTPR